MLGLVNNRQSAFYVAHRHTFKRYKSGKEVLCRVQTLYNLCTYDTTMSNNNCVHNTPVLAISHDCILPLSSLYNRVTASHPRSWSDGDKTFGDKMGKKKKKNV